MYIIEMHHRTRAFSQIILEKGDAIKSYDELAAFKVIVNHSGDVEIANCKWCEINRRDHLAKERRLNART